MAIPFHFILHHFNIFFGFIGNLLSIIVILHKTPRALQEYSVLLLNIALTELFSLFNHFLVDGRLFISGSTVIFLVDGPCQSISDTFCSLLAAAMNVIMLHSMALVALSFWYRIRILSGEPPLGKVRLQLLSTFIFTPHIAHAIIFLASKTPKSMLIEKVQPYYDPTSFQFYGFADISVPIHTFVAVYPATFSLTTTVYIFWTRGILMWVLHQRSDQLSDRTRSTHESLARILTIHTALPLFLGSGIVACVIAQLYGYHSVDIEGLIYDIAVAPSLVNPMLTLYYVRPYRAFLKGLICKATKKVSIISTASNHENAGHKLSLSQRL